MWTRDKVTKQVGWLNGSEVSYASVMMEGEQEPELKWKRTLRASFPPDESTSMSWIQTPENDYRVLVIGTSESNAIQYTVADSSGAVVNFQGGYGSLVKVVAINTGRQLTNAEGENVWALWAIASVGDDTVIYTNSMNDMTSSSSSSTTTTTNDYCETANVLKEVLRVPSNLYLSLRLIGGRRVAVFKKSDGLTAPNTWVEGKGWIGLDWSGGQWDRLSRGVTVIPCGGSRGDVSKERLLVADDEAWRVVVGGVLVDSLKVPEPASSIHPTMVGRRIAVVGVGGRVSGTAKVWVWHVGHEIRQLTVLGPGESVGLLWDWWMIVGVKEQHGFMRFSPGLERNSERQDALVHSLRGRIGQGHASGAALASVVGGKRQALARGQATLDSLSSAALVTAKDGKKRRLPPVMNLVNVLNFSLTSMEGYEDEADGRPSAMSIVSEHSGDSDELAKDVVKVHDAQVVLAEGAVWAFVDAELLSSEMNVRSAWLSAVGESGTASGRITRAPRGSAGAASGWRFLVSVHVGGPQCLGWGREGGVGRVDLAVILDASSGGKMIGRLVSIPVAPETVTPPALLGPPPPTSVLRHLAVSGSSVAHVLAVKSEYDEKSLSTVLEGALSNVGLKHVPSEAVPMPTVSVPNYGQETGDAVPVDTVVQAKWRARTQVWESMGGNGGPWARVELVSGGQVARLKIAAVTPGVEVGVLASLKASLSGDVEFLPNPIHEEALVVLAESVARGAEWWKEVEALEDAQRRAAADGEFMLRESVAVAIAEKQLLTQDAVAGAVSVGGACCSVCNVSSELNRLAS